MKTSKINCLKCAHFWITWDEGFPRGCRAMGFKCRDMPSALVEQSSGMECLRFEPKKEKPEGRRGSSGR